jgi:insertion element IS1 protein InsB
MNQLDPEDVHGIIEKVATAAVDEMWSYVGTKTQQRWLWHAMDHRTGVMLAAV